MNYCQYDGGYNSHHSTSYHERHHPHRRQSYAGPYVESGGYTYSSGRQGPTLYSSHRQSYHSMNGEDYISSPQNDMHDSLQYNNIQKHYTARDRGTSRSAPAFDSSIHSRPQRPCNSARPRDSMTLRSNTDEHTHYNPRPQPSYYDTSPGDHNPQFVPPNYHTPRRHYNVPPPAPQPPNCVSPLPYPDSPPLQADQFHSSPRFPPYPDSPPRYSERYNASPPPFRQPLQPRSVYHTPKQYSPRPPAPTPPTYDFSSSDLSNSTYNSRKHFSSSSSYNTPSASVSQSSRSTNLASFDSEESDRHIIKNGGWTGRKHFMESHNLGLSNPDDYETAKELLEGYKRVDAAGRAGEYDNDDDRDEGRYDHEPARERVRYKSPENDYRESTFGNYTSSFSSHDNHELRNNASPSSRDDSNRPWTSSFSRPAVEEKDSDPPLRPESLGGAGVRVDVNAGRSGSSFSHPVAEDKGTTSSHDARFARSPGISVHIGNGGGRRGRGFSSSASKPTPTSKSNNTYEAYNTYNTDGSYDDRDDWISDRGGNDGYMDHHNFGNSDSSEDRDRYAYAYANDGDDGYIHDDEYDDEIW